MKKLITIILVALVPFISMAQKRSKKDKTAKSEIKSSVWRFMVIKGFSITDQSNTDVLLEEFHFDHNDVNTSLDKVRIWFDFGTNINNEAAALLEKSIEMRSLTDAVNLLGNYGWEFVSANIERDGQFTTYYYYMKKKV
tara:strand:- start:133 stop:549 length:417 start_codon:yes stop_codon:yes gene_type:complete